jgi:hypothetical protein
MKHERNDDRIAAASPGDGTYAGARKLYLARGLGMSLLERLQEAERMSETAKFLQNASMDKRPTR